MPVSPTPCDWATLGEGPPAPNTEIGVKDFFQGLACGVMIGFKVVASAFVLFLVLIACFCAPMPMCYVAPDIIPVALSAIWSE